MSEGASSSGGAGVASMTTVETPFDPTKLMEVAEQLKAVMDAHDTGEEVDEEAVRLAMDKAMELYIEFQNQFGGQLADAVPTEEFEALQACLSSADYDGALEVARSIVHIVAEKFGKLLAIKELIDRRITATRATVLSAVQEHATEGTRVRALLSPSPRDESSASRARATRRAQGGHGYLEHARSGQDADRHGSRRARRRHVRRAREHARPPAATARAPLLLSLREVRARGFVTRGRDARADRALLVARAPLHQRVDPVSHTDLPRGRRHRAVLLVVPAAARLGAAAILHRSGARRAPLAQPLPSRPSPPSPRDRSTEPSSPRSAYRLRSRCSAGSWFCELNTKSEYG